ncbi:hypothetical protein F444_19783 [Phytophthora nicotianae P1976]|uniref:Uncharacterized protein n=1 Tax=Phytophthora nicotianae P1976 TaxID=1317066 RepID=A0A080Z6M5_PHYNI|nr:hypothetical protein F444_19783 [Phytophthora nicotianae P1976]
MTLPEAPGPDRNLPKNIASSKREKTTSKDEKKLVTEQKSPIVNFAVPRESVAMEDVRESGDMVGDRESDPMVGEINSEGKLGQHDSGERGRPQHWRLSETSIQVCTKANMAPVPVFLKLRLLRVKTIAETSNEYFNEKINEKVEGQYEKQKERENKILGSQKDHVL